MRILPILIFIVFCSIIFAQISGTKDELLLSGEVAFWPLEEAKLSSEFVDGEIDEEGNFSLVFPQLKSYQLYRIEEYIGISCLSSSNPDSKSNIFSYLDVLQGNQEVGKLYLNTPLFDFQVGEAYMEFHYFSEATTISGRCVDKFDDGFEVIYEFPNLEVRTGWNELYGTITDTTDNSETYTFSLDTDGHNFVWEIEPLSLDSYTGIGASIGYTENKQDGILVNEVFADQPAELSGLMADDLIIDIDGYSTLGMSVSVAVFYLRGPEETAVSVTVLRDGDTLEFEIIRSVIDD